MMLHTFFPTNKHMNIEEQIIQKNKKIKMNRNSKNEINHDKTMTIGMGFQQCRFFSVLIWILNHFFFLDLLPGFLSFVWCSSAFVDLLEEALVFLLLEFRFNGQIVVYDAWIVFHSFKSSSIWKNKLTREFKSQIYRKNKGSKNVKKFILMLNSLLASPVHIYWSCQWIVLAPANETNQQTGETKESHEYEEHIW